MWPQAEAAVNAEHAAAVAAANYRAQLETVAREYARGQWQTLRRLLGGYLDAQVPAIEQTDPCTVPAA